jgi:hypothetical protein
MQETVNNPEYQQQLQFWFPYALDWYFIPLVQNRQHMNTLIWLQWADYTPDKTAVTSYDDPESYTYAAIHNYANHVVNHLISIYSGRRSSCCFSRTRSVLSGAFFGMPTFGRDTYTFEL